jgi:hypothetical protein
MIPMILVCTSVVLVICSLWFGLPRLLNDGRIRVDDHETTPANKTKAASA